MTQYVRVIILLVKEIQSKPAFPVLLRNVPVGRSRLSPAKLADFTQGFTKNPHHLTFPFTLQQYTRSHAPALGDQFGISFEISDFKAFYYEYWKVIGC